MAEGPQALIMFGDGFQALYYGEKNVEKNREGIRVLPLLIVPSLELRRRYDLTDDDLTEKLPDGRWGTWMSYPINEVDWLNKSMNDAVIFIWCGYDGRPTNIMRKPELMLEDMKFRDKIEDDQERRIAYLNQIIIDTTANQGDIFKTLKDYQDIMVGNVQEDNDENNV
jgi:hypothetical protein